MVHFKNVPLAFMAVMALMGFAALPSSLAQKEPAVARALQDEGAPLYKVSVYSSSGCLEGEARTTADDDKIQASFLVRVVDASGARVANAGVSVLLASSDGTRTYSQAGTTNRRGRAGLAVDIDPEESGKSLWCSIAVTDPSLPQGMSQQVACSFTAATCDP
jgi:hypothetical protein